MSVLTASTLAESLASAFHLSTTQALAFVKQSQTWQQLQTPAHPLSHQSLSYILSLLQTEYAAAEEEDEDAEEFPEGVFVRSH